MTFLALCLFGIGADLQLHRSFRVLSPSPGAAVNALVVLGVAWLACILLLGALGGLMRPIAAFLPLLILGGAIFVRAATTFLGPLVFLGLYDLIQLSSAGGAVLALLLLCRTNLKLGAGVWIVALIVILAARLAIPGAIQPLAPDLLALALSLPCIVLVLLAVRGASRSESAVPRFGIFLSHLLALGLGLAIALAALNFQSATLLSPPLGEYASVSLESLWSRSVLAGWGRNVTLRLLRVATEPEALPELLWLGHAGTLAMFGAGAFVCWGLISCWLLFLDMSGTGRRGGLGRLGPGASGGLWLPAQALGAAVVWGGPNSLVPGFVWFGWICLGWAVAVADRGEESKRTGRLFASLSSTAEGGFIVVGLTLLTLIAAFPVASNAFLSRGSRSRAPDEAASARAEDSLTSAGRLNPWNPEIELARAAAMRLTLTQRRTWDEPLFEDIRDAYLRAQRLDPYDASIVLRLADIFSRAERHDQALDVARRALLSNPGSIELREWVFLYGSSHNRPDVVRDAIASSLRLQPDSAKWRRRSFVFYRNQGLGSQAGRQLDVALTAATDPKLLEASLGLVRLALLREAAVPARD